MLSDDALWELDNIDQMYFDGLLTEKVQAHDSKGRVTVEVCTVCILFPSLGLVCLGCEGAQETCVSTCWLVVHTATTSNQEIGR